MGYGTKEHNAALRAGVPKLKRPSLKAINDYLDFLADKVREDKMAEKGILPESVTKEVISETAAVPAVLEKRFVGKIKKLSTTPDVQNIEHWDAQNAGPVNITNFMNGQDGQHLYLLGDGQTTLVHGTKIFNNTGANKLLAANKVYHYVKRSGSWYEVV